jgi:hypothetical protein
MARWRLFGKSKPKEEEIIKPVETISKEVEEVEIEIEQEPEKKTLAEYHETLQSGVSTSKKGKSKKQRKMQSDQRIWRDVNCIEEKVDNLHITRAKKPDTEIDKTVDKLVTKKKKK